MKYHVHSRWYLWASERTPDAHGIEVHDEQVTRRPVEYPAAMAEIDNCRFADAEHGMGLADYWLVPA